MPCQEYKFANEAEAKKKPKYACLLPTFDFIPLAVETLGSLGDDACAFMYQLGRRILSVTGEQRNFHLHIQLLIHGTDWTKVLLHATQLTV